MKNLAVVLLIITGLITVSANGQKMSEIKNLNNVKFNRNLLKTLKPIPVLSYTVKQKKEESTTTPSTDCPGTSVKCTVTRANLEAPIFGSSLFTLPRDLFVGNIFDVNEFKNSGIMNPKIMGERNKITISAYTQSAGGTVPLEIDATQAQYMAFLTSARSELDKLIGDTKPIESAEYNIESINSEDHMKATLGASYSDPQNFFDFKSSVSSNSKKQYAILKFIEKSFDVSMDSPTTGLFSSPTTVPSTYGFVSNISYGRIALLIFETSRNDFDLKATLQGGLNAPGAEVSGNASLQLSTVQSNIKVRLVLQGFNANPSYSALLSNTSMNNSIIEKVNAIIGGAIGTRIAAIPIMITAKKATLIDNSYPEITQTVTFNNVPLDKECVTIYPPSSTKYKYEVSFNKIYSTKAAWGSEEQLYGRLNCDRVIASKGSEFTASKFNLAILSKPNHIKINKEKAYNLSSLINGLAPRTITFIKPECISEQEFLKNSYIQMNADLKIIRDPFAAQEFNKNSRFKKHSLNSITTIGPYNEFGNSCNASNQGIICTTTEDGQNFQISYTIKRIRE